MTETPISSANGYTGALEFDGQTVTITHNWRGKVGGWKEPHRIDLSQIQMVTFEPVRALTNGKIEIHVPGETQIDGETSRNSVVFTKKQAGSFEAISDAIQAALSNRSPEQLETSQRLVDEHRAERLRAVSMQYGRHHVAGGVYRSSDVRSGKPIAGASAEFESGADRSRSTLTRIGAGAILAGPAGAIVGGLLKKDKSKCYVTVIFADGDTVIIEGPSKDEGKMRKFAADVNRIAARAAAND